MDFFLFYVGLFFIFFLIMPMVYFALQFILWVCLNKCCGGDTRGFQDPVRRRRRRQRQRERRMVGIDRQGNAFNVPDEPSGNRYGDIFFIEPGSVEANRIRDQLEKDEKDLPSYDEVMRMCNLTTPTAAAAGTPQSPLGEVPAPIGIAALPAPPYSETDPQAAAAAGGATVIAMEPVEPSTSRAAQTPPSSGGCGPPAPPPTAV
ncbi:uncharacterized protein LOC128254191 isoform X5 [Drosophila gunungcola]|uniref:uncharacterized protein LOC128254191 isoform X5 n=1 Tax=Drosophila gunungcola TaxID=103775 RepID=UPI0022E45EB8|nr:uncharacterized protein LOC128254191 isoform X5 [Drosophila gunungcola]